MSKPQKNPVKRDFSKKQKKVKQARKELRKRKMAQAVEEATKNSGPSNRMSAYNLVEDEREERQNAVSNQVQTYRAQLKKLLEDFAKIPDPRRPKSVKHKLTVVLLYGLLSCLFQMASRREANRDMSRPAFLQALQGLFPELETLPHGDTLARLLERIDLQMLEESFVKLLRKYIRNKKFKRYLINNCYPIAIDGTQKLVRDGDLWGEDWLERHIKTKNGEKTQQYVYVLEANLVFSNGLIIPLLSEFLSYSEGDCEKSKQDCELNAFKRLASKLKKYFPRLPIILLMDGLYANGPVMALCREYNWEYMIVLQDACLSSVWKKFEAMRPQQSDNEKSNVFNGREQRFYWVNGIYYAYDNNKGVLVNVVVCEETWQVVDPNTGEIIDKSSRHAWISSNSLDKENVHERCNLGARHRWGIEDSMNTEKNRGYCYEHPFSHNFSAMQGYHYLMRMAHAFNALAQRTSRGAKFVREMGIQPFLKFVRETLTGLWLEPEWMAQLLKKPFQLRLE